MSLAITPRNLSLSKFDYQQNSNTLKSSELLTERVRIPKVYFDFMIKDKIKDSKRDSFS